MLSLSQSRPDLVDWDSLKPGNNAANLMNAFDVAERDLGIARLLDVEGKVLQAAYFGGIVSIPRDFIIIRTVF